MSDDRCPEHNCDIAVCFEEHKMKDEAFEKAWRTSPWFGNAHERTVAWSFWQAASLNQAVQAEAHLHEPQTAETCQHVPPHPIGCLVLKEPDGPVGSIHVFAEDEEFICLACEADKQGRDAALDEAWEIAFHADSAPNAAKEIHRLREGGRK